MLPRLLVTLAIQECLYLTWYAVTMAPHDLLISHHPLEINYKILKIMIIMIQALCHKAHDIWYRNKLSLQNTLQYDDTEKPHLYKWIKVCFKMIFKKISWFRVPHRIRKTVPYMWPSNRSLTTSFFFSFFLMCMECSNCVVHRITNFIFLN